MSIQLYHQIDILPLDNHSTSPNKINLHYAQVKLLIKINFLKLNAKEINKDLFQNKLMLPSLIKYIRLLILTN